MTRNGYSLLIWGIILMLNSALATTFIPISIEKQIESGSAASEVELIESKSFEVKKHFIQTEYTFKVLEPFNLKTDEIENKILKIELPGGSLNGVTTAVDGAPNFVKGQKFFLLLKKVGSKIYLSNFTAGVFKIVKINDEIFYVNEVFGNVPNSGRISKIKMTELMNKAWSKEVQNQIPEEKKVDIKSDLKNSFHEQGKNQQFDINEPVLSLKLKKIFAVFILIIISLILFYRFKRARDEK